MRLPRNLTGEGQGTKTVQNRLGAALWVGKKNPRTDLLFRDAAIQVPLAQRCFTTQFGMGWGGSSVL